MILTTRIVYHPTSPSGHLNGETIEAFERQADRNLATLRRQIQTSTYQPLPLPKKSQPKPGELLKTEWRG